MDSNHEQERDAWRSLRSRWTRWFALTAVIGGTALAIVLAGGWRASIVGLETSGDLTETGIASVQQPQNTPAPFPPSTRPFPAGQATGAGAAQEALPQPSPTATQERTALVSDQVSTPGAVGITAVVGAGGAVIFSAEDGAQAAQLPVGTALRLVARSADSAWLLTQVEQTVGWVSRDSVIVFNVNRLPIADRMPPAHLTESPATSIDQTAGRPTPTLRPTATQPAQQEPTAAPTAPIRATNAASTVASASAAFTLTAQLDAAKARGLNVRSGPGVIYAVVGAVTPDDVLIVRGRNRAGDWVYVEGVGGALQGWASAYYLRIEGDVQMLPVRSVETRQAGENGQANSAPLSPSSLPTSSLPTSSATASPSPTADSAGSDLSGTLVFQTSQGGDIYAYDLESGKLWRLTSGFDPAIHPDGSTVAFTRAGDQAGLYLIDIDGGNERKIYSGPQGIASPKWSEDGSQIAFSYTTSSRQCRDLGNGVCVSDEEFQTRRFRDLDPNNYPLITVYTYDLAVVNADGSGFRSLSALSSARAPDWGAGGIVYQSSDGLQLIELDGSGSRTILYDPLRPADQDPDVYGDRIVFQRPGAGHWQIWSTDLNGANVRALTQPQSALVDRLPSSVSPTFSPDGRHIAFLSNRTESGEAGEWRIWVMDADGGNQRALPIDLPIRYTFGGEQMIGWGGK
ncbi:MAG: SH3 domain-containing protein [Caldilinea sp.]|nr:SH3 domain-containing protein [Caldilinea sp.]MDW8441346.1 SH3 domain-containing protein [Caldilineaceae bacterium]